MEKTRRDEVKTKAKAQIREMRRKRNTDHNKNIKLKTVRYGEFEQIKVTAKSQK